MSSGLAALQAARKPKGTARKADRHYLPATPELQEWAAALAAARSAAAERTAKP